MILSGSTIPFVHGADRSSMTLTCCRATVEVPFVDHQVAVLRADRYIYPASLDIPPYHHVSHRVLSIRPPHMVEA